MNQRTFSLTDLSSVLPNVIGLHDMLTHAHQLAEGQKEVKYPPYDLVALSDDKFAICIAVAGFSQSDINIFVEKNILNVEGKITKPDGAEAPKYIHQGIAKRAFKRQFPLYEHIEVTGAGMQDGILTINLERNIPEEAKPKSIPIEVVESTPKLENQDS
ncbi:Hsp20 family protein [Neptuniibacter sp. QD37_11]|uniref:Hsp20 family protein n=1 Tax=Neptuniibacter sp. QD37_11 TaxID=3398209 RepID=UPI0039F5B255